MKRIGILCASDTELAPFLPLIAPTSTTRWAMLDIHHGQLHGIPVVAAYSGVCKVNAAIAAQVMIDRCQVDGMIHAGVAGGIDPGIRLLDTVISTETAYHDMAEDILTEFHPWLPTIYFPADEALLATARAYAATAKQTIHFGRMVTGERFITDEEREEIARRFAPLTVDMETAAVAHVCHVDQVPFLAVRTITDTADHRGMAQFEENCVQASHIAAQVVSGIVARLAERDEPY